MRLTEQVYSWEVDGLRRQLEAVEDRLNRRDQARRRAWATLLWMIYAAGIVGMLATAALS